MGNVSDLCSARQQRQLAAISEFTTDIQHMAGKHNGVADCLSRVLVSSVHLGLDYSAMAADQLGDAGLEACRSAVTGLQLVDVSRGWIHAGV